MPVLDAGHDSPNPVAHADTIPCGGLAEPQKHAFGFEEYPIPGAESAADGLNGKAPSADVRSCEVLKMDMSPPYGSESVQE